MTELPRYGPTAPTYEEWQYADATWFGAQQEYGDTDPDVMSAAAELLATSRALDKL